MNVYVGEYILDESRKFESAALKKKKTYVIEFWKKSVKIIRLCLKMLIPFLCT